MSFDVSFIGPLKSGLSQYFKPYAIGKDAFVSLENCYTWRGSVRKREGSSILARVPAWSPAASVITNITNASPPVVTFIGHGLLTNDMVWLENVVTTNGAISAITISPDDTSPTVITTAGAHGMSVAQNVAFTGITGSIGNSLNYTKQNQNTYEILAVGANSITINFNSFGLVYTAGGSVLVGNLEQQVFQITRINANSFSLQYLNGNNVVASGAAASGDLYLPIVGTRTFILTTNGNEQLVCFTPKQAFLLNTSSFPATFTNVSFDTNSNAILWTGTKDSFVYSSNYARVMWTTNNVDPIRYFNGSTTAGFSNMIPIVNGSTTMTACLMILPYKGRLVTLNTTEGGTNFFNRARWSQNGTPFAGVQAPVNITNVAPSVSPTTITAPGHGFTNGQSVGITNIVGSVGNVLNGNTYVIQNVVGNNFDVLANTFGLIYTSGGLAQLMVVPPTGFGTNIDAWRDDIPGKGGFIDADTSEKIVSAEIINDTMIVGFQFSTWRLRYTGNEILPFIWERINTQLGSEATFSIVPFDDAALMISRRGIIAANFNSVDRIDMEIPDIITSFETGIIGESLNRIHGIRDYEKRLLYWIYPDASGPNFDTIVPDNNEENLTPNKILCLNYQDKTWAIFNASYTCLGIYKQTEDNTWATWTTPWLGDNSTWADPFDQENIVINVAGAKDGRVWRILDSDVTTDNGVNYGFLITTGFINPYLQQGKRCKLAYVDLYLTTTSDGQITLEHYTNDNSDKAVLTRTIDTNISQQPPGGTTKYFRVYLGLVSRSHQITLTMTNSQITNTLIGPSNFELQGIVLHTREEGRVKNF